MIFSRCVDGSFYFLAGFCKWPAIKRHETKYRGDKTDGTRGNKEKLQIVYMYYIIALRLWPMDWNELLKYAAPTSPRKTIEMCSSEAAEDTLDSASKTRLVRTARVFAKLHSSKTNPYDN